MPSLTLRPGDSLTTPKVALSMGYRSLVTLLSAIQATGILALTPAGLTPAERASLVAVPADLQCYAGKRYPFVQEAT